MVDTFVRQSVDLYHIYPLLGEDICDLAVASGQARLLKNGQYPQDIQFDVMQHCIMLHPVMEMLQILREKGYPWNSEICISTAIGGHLHTIKWIRENGGQWNGNCAYSAAYMNRVDILQYMYNRGHRFQKQSIINVALIYGNIDVLKRAHENRFKIWDPVHKNGTIIQTVRGVIITRFDGYAIR